MKTSPKKLLLSLICSSWLFIQPAWAHEDFIASAGYEELVLHGDQADINWEQYYQSDYFADAADSAFKADGQMEAAARALLLFNAIEGPIQHARYYVSAHVQRPESGQEPHTYVEIIRYNLGEMRYEEVMKNIESAQRPDKSEFTPGPHLAWRLILGPVQGNQSDAFRISRKELPTAQIQRQYCFDVRCLSLEDPPIQGQSWQAMEAPDFAEPVYTEPQTATMGPVEALDQLYYAAIGRHGPAEINEAASIQQPELKWVISQNLDGQEAYVQGTLLQANVMDDAIQNSWTRLMALPQQEPIWEQRVDYRPGRS